MKRIKTVLFIAAAICAAMLAPRPAAAQAFNEQTVMVPMPDGVRLATDLFLPKTDKRVATVLVRTTYGRKGFANMILPLMAGKGMALVIQDTRGLHDSEGISSTFIDDALDGYETVEWIARQPWSNGKVGTAGISALGITQYIMHKKPPPSLTCQHVMAAPESLFHTIVYQGGAVRRALFYGWVMNQRFPPHVLQLILAQVDYNEMWQMLNLGESYDKVRVPIMHMAGWYDLYTRGNIEAYMGIRKHGDPSIRDKQYLVIGPWTHGHFLGFNGTKLGQLQYPDNIKYDFSKIIDFFQERFYGRDKGIMSGPRVRYYVMGAVDEPSAPGNEWRSAEDWPVPADHTAFYLHSDGALNTSKPAGEGELTIVDNPADPVPTLGSREHAEQREPVDLRPIESRGDILVFTTPPLEQPLEVTGHIKAKLYFTTDVADTDFVVRLSDVYPDGRSMLVTDGIARAQRMQSLTERVLLEPGKPYEIEIEVWPTSIIFNKGHRIRVSVSGTNFPRFDVNSHTGQYHNYSWDAIKKAFDEGKLEEYVYTPNPAPDAKIAHTKISVSADRPSHIVLPLAPKK
mgnify:CR=1 FL=1